MSGERSSLGTLWELSRPFTLLPPLLGMLSGSAAALGATSGDGDVRAIAGRLVLGSLMAAVLNAASNVLNQIYDRDLDRVNKPERPIPSGRISIKSAGRFAALLYAGAVALAFSVQPGNHPELGVIVLVTVVLTWIYSAPPLRLRNSWWAGPLVIAIPRGGLLKVAGWACVAPVFSDREPWIIAAIFFLFVLGCAPIKDFGDMEGDRRGGASSLPLRFGRVRAAHLMAPFYVLPWVALAALPHFSFGGRPLLGVPPLGAAAVGVWLSVSGLVAVLALLRSVKSGRPVGVASWRLLYLLMMEAQVLLAVLYLV